MLICVLVPVCGLSLRVCVCVISNQSIGKKPCFSKISVNLPPVKKAVGIERVFFSGWCCGIGGGGGGWQVRMGRQGWTKFEEGVMQYRGSS